MSAHPTIKFHDGNSIPQVGLGVWQTPDDTAVVAVKAALEAGYRHVDTAAIYENEKGVGEGLRASDVDRTEIFLTTKVWNSDQGYDSTIRAFEKSLARLGTHYVDLYLIHWPAPRADRYVETWKAFIQLQQEGRARSIGVSNFCPEHIDRLISETGVSPVINQVELHPDFPQSGLRRYHEEKRIATQSWSPLGQGTLLGNPVIAKIAAKHGRTPAQVITRWHIDHGLVVIPKSVTPSRIIENFQVFDFSLDIDDMAKFGSLENDGNRIGPEPTTFHP